MSTFVLVHGSWHGGWCWEKLVPLLELRGHRVLTPDLPAHGDDHSALQGFTLPGCTERITALLHQESEPVHLVGHSSGGVTITQVAEACPDKIATLVYLCAYLPANGQTLLQLFQSDPTSQLMVGLTIDPQTGISSITKEAAHDYFYADCPRDDAERAAGRLRPESLALPSTPVHTTAERWGKVPRVYIECTRDRAVTPSMQRHMSTVLPCQKVLSLDAGHAPFYSAPAALASLLLDEVLPIAAPSPGPK